MPLLRSTPVEWWPISRRSGWFDPEQLGGNPAGLSRPAHRVRPAAMGPAAAHPAGRRGVGGEQWLHEIKFDGYRMHARLDRGDVRLPTRTGLDWTHKYPAIAAAVAT